VNLLLDTHALLWWLDDSELLSERAADAIAAADHLVFVSAVTIWECRIKQALGKLDLPDDFAEVLAAQPFVELDVTAAHAHGVAQLPPIHGDPFDRMLASQARLERFTLVTSDVWLHRYPIETLW
jgi:PIN domain nuclease of toxin-antitoxin system